MHDRKAKAMNDTSSPSVADGTDKKASCGENRRRHSF